MTKFALDEENEDSEKEEYILEEEDTMAKASLKLAQEEREIM